MNIELIFSNNLLTLFHMNKFQIDKIITFCKTIWTLTGTVESSELESIGSWYTYYTRNLYLKIIIYIEPIEHLV